MAIRALAPELEIHAPIRDLGWSREQESAWLAERGIHIDPHTVAYSINAGLFGTTIGGRETHDTWNVPPESVYTRTASRAEAPAEGQEVVIGFERGLPVSSDGEGSCVEPEGSPISIRDVTNAHGIPISIEIFSYGPLVPC